MLIQFKPCVKVCPSFQLQSATELDQTLSPRFSTCSAVNENLRFSSFFLQSIDSRADKNVDHGKRLRYQWLIHESIRTLELEIPELDSHVASLFSVNRNPLFRG